MGDALFVCRCVQLRINLAVQGLRHYLRTLSQSFLVLLKLLLHVMMIGGWLDLALTEIGSSRDLLRLVEVSLLISATPDHLMTCSGCLSCTLVTATLPSLTLCRALTLLDNA